MVCNGVSCVWMMSVHVHMIQEKAQSCTYVCRNRGQLELVIYIQVKNNGRVLSYVGTIFCCAYPK